MLNEKNVALGEVRSSIRELFEYGKIRKSEIGEDNVFDFSLGNPSVPAPREVNEYLKEIIDSYDPVYLHGYTSAQGDMYVREVIAQNLNKRFKTNLDGDNLYMTCGAAASLTITLNAILNEGDEVLVFSPYFPEYKVFVEHAGAVFVPVPCDKKTFQPDLDVFAGALTPKTKAVIINSPNNPSGVVYGEKIIKGIAKILTRHCKRNEPVYIVSDEPYRELVYGATVPFIMNYYDRSVVCYSYSKSLSLPGERIGYIAVNNKMEEWKKVYTGICGAGRALGYVCAPNLFQQLVAKADGLVSDVSVYKKNRGRLSTMLEDFGYEIVKPDGAFYLFVKSLEPDAKAFAERAKKHELLVVPGDDFGCPGYVRVSYCVSPSMIEKSLSAFEALAKEYNEVGYVRE